jgi:hypothetical protein
MCVPLDSEDRAEIKEIMAGFAELMVTLGEWAVDVSKAAVRRALG